MQMSTGSTSIPRRWIVMRSSLAAMLAVTMVSTLAVETPRTAAAEDGKRRPAPTAKPVPSGKAGVRLTPLPKTDGALWRGPKDSASWPAAGSVDLAVAGVDGAHAEDGSSLPRGKAKAGGLPVSVAAPERAKQSPERVEIKTLDRKVSQTLGVSGPVFTVSSAAAKAHGDVDVTVDYSSFRNLYGADWAARLELVKLPACAATSPGKKACATATSAESANDVGKRTVSAKVDTADERTDATVFALTATSSSKEGDYKATDLAASGSWTAGTGSGEFSYSNPMRMPPAEGPIPKVSVSYSSQAVDGRTSGKNNQASWTGDGWTYSPGYVERSYQTCANDQAAVGGQNPNNTATKTGDLCWFSENATISLNGMNGTLVKDATTGKWRVESDANWKVDLIKSTLGSAGRSI